MKILCIHADYIRYKATKKAIKSVPDADKTEKEVKDCLVVFTAVENGDEKDKKKIVDKFLKEVNNIAKQLGVNKVVLYPYAHLSSDLASPKTAVEILDMAEKALSKNFNVTRSPFGWYKQFEYKCKGHPLSELSRKIEILDKVKAKKGEDENFALKRDKLSKSERIALSSAYVLARALKNLYPKASFGSAGFYQDQAYLDVSVKIKQTDFKRIEKEVNKLLNAGVSFSRGKKFNLDKYQKLIHEDLGRDAAIYNSGNLSVVPIYQSPFVEAKEIRSFKMMNIASAYWKNNAQNEQLTRLYCIAFKSPVDEKEFLKNLEEAQARSHLKIGKEQKLFVISDLVGPGLPLLAPNGMIIREEIVNYLWSLHQGKGYQKVWIPHIAKNLLYKKSGHWDKFGDELFHVKGQYESFVMKPMNCPHHIQIFNMAPLSYRDLPVRYFEPTTNYRDEKPGQLLGLSRVRSLTQDDGHIFCRVNQIEAEVKTVAGIISKFYKTLGMDKNYWVSLSVRGDDKSLYLGEEKVWSAAERALEKVAKEIKLPYKKIKGEAAFYGPKLDFMFKDALGREWQLATIQLDFNLPDRFELSIVNEKNQKERPVMIHRAISGSLERFMSVLIEHFAGKFPLWLSPTQVKVISFNDSLISHARKIEKQFLEAGFRVSGDYRSESVQAKVRDAELQKIPYIIVIGDKEKQAGTLAVRPRGKKPQFGVKADKFIKDLQKENDDKVIK